MKRICWVVLLLVVALSQVGCVLGRRTFSLAMPTMKADMLPQAGRGPVRLTNVKDCRTFENKPKDPSTPSVNGDVRKYTAEQRAQMIGRQRNTYGMAMGDLALSDGDSVIERTRILVTEGLKRRGYEVTDDPKAATVEVSIDQFWAWMTPGFWALSFESRVYCTLTFTRAGKSTTVVVKGYYLNHGQIAKDGNWQEAYDGAFKDFLKNFEMEMIKASL